MNLMNQREFASALRHAKRILLYIDYSPDDDGAVWLIVPRSMARLVLDSAKEGGVAEVAAHMKGQDLYVGDPNDWPDEEEEEEEIEPEDPEPESD